MPENIAGRNPVLESLKVARSNVEAVFIASGSSGDRIDDIRRIAKKQKVNCHSVSRNEVDRMVPNNQGVVAVVNIPHAVGLEELIARPSVAEHRRIILLDEVQDPVNLGKIIRTALFFGVDGLIKTKHSTAPLNATVMKVSAGAAARLPVAEVVNLRQAIDRLKEERFWFVGTVMDGDCSPDAIPVDRNLGLIFGHEGKGLRRLTRELCDYLVTIAGGGSFDSLNVGVAAGILTYALRPERGG